MQNGFDPCSYHAKRNRTHMTCKTRLCKTFQSKFKCFHYQLGTLGGHINQLKTCHRNIHACQCTRLSRFVKNSVHAKV